MDPLRSDLSPDVPTGAERDARIEQLLLSGLDCYFAANYEQAINLWTRVLFLDRHHDRARAYIERARSAQAERLRESEALLHQGMAAFDAGEVERARQLVGDALERGVSRDLALGVLDRIERLEAGAPAARADTGPAGHAAPKAQRARRWISRHHEPRLEEGASTPSRVRGWLAAVLLVLAGVGALAVGVWGVALPDPRGWGVFAGSAQRPAPVLSVSPAPLPVPGATESFLARAKALFGRGRLRDALRELDRIPLGDTLYADAQDVRSAIQRELLTIAAAEEGGPRRE